MIVEILPRAEERQQRTETLVLLWRIEQFHRLGFGELESWQLARSEADLGVARRIRGGGCSVELALQILG